MIKIRVVRALRELLTVRMLCNNAVLVCKNRSVVKSTDYFFNGTFLTTVHQRVE